MKKLYTLLLAVAVACTATAQLPFKAEKGLVKADVQKVVTSKSSVKKIQDMERYGKTAADFWSGSRADELPVIDNTFMLISANDTTATCSDFDAYPCHIYEDSSEPSGSGFYLIDNFFIPDALQVEAELVVKNVQVSETDAIPLIFLTIPTGTPIYKDNAGTYELSLAGYGKDEQGKTVLYAYTDDIDFVLMNDGSFMLWLGDNVTGLCMLPKTGDSLYNLTFNSRMPICNGQMQAFLSEDVTEDGQFKGKDITCDLYAEYNAETNNLFLCNYGGYYSGISLTVDPAKAEATATEQILLSRYMQGYLLQAYISSKPSEVLPVVFAMRSEEGRTILTNDGLALVVKAGTYPGVNQNSWWSFLFESTIVLDLDIPIESGIEDITVADTNAPVEYYNLQGLRVENPANGLYIKRQGKTATKVFVK